MAKKYANSNTLFHHRSELIQPIASNSTIQIGSSIFQSLPLSRNNFIQLHTYLTFALTLSRLLLLFIYKFSLQWVILNNEKYILLLIPKYMFVLTLFSLFTFQLISNLKIPKIKMPFKLGVSFQLMRLNSICFLYDDFAVLLEVRRLQAQPNAHDISWPSIFLNNCKQRKRNG